MNRRAAYSLFHRDPFAQDNNLFTDEKGYWASVSGQIARQSLQELQALTELTSVCAGGSHSRRINMESLPASDS